MGSGLQPGLPPAVTTHNISQRHEIVDAAVIGGDDLKQHRRVFSAPAQLETSCVKHRQYSGLPNPAVTQYQSKFPLHAVWIFLKIEF